LKLNQQGGLATLLNMVVVGSNIVALNQDGLSAGDSHIWGINGEPVAQGKPFTECLVTAEIDRTLLTQEHRPVNPGKVAPNLYQMIGAAARTGHSSGQQGVE
jgi:predicted amidohydrolase